MNHTHTPFRSLALMAALCATTLTAAAQPQPTPTPTPPPQQPEPKPAPAPTSEPSLDELLGLPATTPPKPAEATQPAPTPDDAIKRALQDADKPAGFGDIVELMSTAGDRLTARSDAGLDTQRTQEDALRKLDKLISDAKKQQQQKKKQKSKSKSKPEDSPSEQQQQQQQQSSQAEQRASSSSQQSSTGGGPGRQDGPLKTPLAGGEASWGNLPPHVRDALRQGSSDRFSSLYRTLTEEYYKRLAEQPRPASTRPNPEDETP